jgi:hypothetical protein
VNVVNGTGEPIALYRVGIMREHDQRQFAVVRSSPRIISFEVMRPTSCGYAAPCGRSPGTKGAGSCSFSGGWRAEKDAFFLAGVHKEGARLSEPR